MEQQTEKKLQVRDLRISFRTNAGKVQAVRNISFDLIKGETLAIVGESGSGKSVTSKAILGIQAANAIYEGGQILFDGQDLLKIGEEDFYKLRGDKLAMIFQDPLSSLNPIMRIGKQLTEAMLLKGKARQKASKDNFEGKLDQLEKAMVAARPEQAGQIREQCALFRRFEARHTQLEQKYNEARDAAENVLPDIDNLLYLIEKNATDGIREKLNDVHDTVLRTVHPDVMPDRDEVRGLANAIMADLRRRIRDKDLGKTSEALQKLRDALGTAVSREKPDFFGMGYYLETAGSGCPDGTVAEKNRFYTEYIGENFLKSFTDNTRQGMQYSGAEYRQKREKALEVLKELLPQLRTADNENTIHDLTEKMSKAVDASICPLDLIKDSTACTFSSGLKGFADTWSTGVRTNAGKIRKTEKQQARYDKLVARGKEPDWKVAAASVIDLDQTRENMVRHTEFMIRHYEEKNSVTEDPAVQADAMIEYLRKNASGMVYKVTKQAARNRALRLMEEVGIPEARKRYRAYPFQFSGGMRQRIVIAIALAADPEVLICDEPTTALDVTIQAQILELINRLKKERNLSIIFITHDLGVVANMADKIAVMYAGQIVEYGTSEEIFYSPAHPYTWALLSSMPDLDTKEKLEAIPGTPPNMIYPPKGDAFAERNRYAMKIDFEKQPPKFNITETHWAATWLLHPDAPHVDPPQTMTERIRKMKARTEARNNE